MSPSITFSGVDTAISNLNYRNTRALKYKFVNAIRNYYTSERQFDTVSLIETDELIGLIWETEDPKEIRSKRINFNSIKAAVNQDLKKLYDKGLNTEGLTVSNDNTFEMSAEAKDHLLESFVNSIRADGKLDFHKVSMVLNMVNSFLESAQSTIEDKDSDEVIRKIQSILNNLSTKVVDTDGDGPEVGEGQKLVITPDEHPDDEFEYLLEDDEDFEMEGFGEDEEDGESEDDTEELEFLDPDEEFEDDDFDEDEYEDILDEEVDFVDEDEDDEFEIDQDPDDDEYEEIEIDEDELEDGDEIISEVDEKEDELDFIDEEDEDFEIEEDPDEEEYEEIEIDEDELEEGDEIISEVDDGEDELDFLDEEDEFEIEEDLSDDEYEELEIEEEEEELEYIDEEEDEEFEQEIDDDEFDDIEYEEDDVELDEDTDELDYVDDDELDEEEIDDDEFEDIEVEEDEEIEIDEDDDFEFIDDDEFEFVDEDDLEFDDDEVEELDADDFEEIEIDDDDDIDIEELDEETDIEEIDDDEFEFIDEDEDDEDVELEELDEDEFEEFDEDFDFEEIDEDDTEIEEIEDDFEFVDDEDEEDVEFEELDDEDFEEFDEDLFDEDFDYEEVEDDEVDFVDEDEEEEFDLSEVDDDFDELELAQDELDDFDILDDDDTDYTKVSDRNRLRAEKFDEFLGSIEKQYNIYEPVPAGRYIVGTENPVGNELIEQRVTLPDIYLGKYPVTNSLFEIFVQKTGYVTTAEKKGFGKVYSGRLKKIKDPDTGVTKTVWNSTFSSIDVKGATWFQPEGPGSSLHNKRNNPVVQVSHEDCEAFAKWVGKRLPTEFEWEGAARTKKGLKYPWGNRFDKKICNIELSEIADTSNVDRFPDGANRYEIFDLIGNVLEWTRDETDPPYKRESSDKYYIVKGGSFISDKTVTLYSRSMFKVDFTSNILGFRCVLK